MYVRVRVNLVQDADGEEGDTEYSMELDAEYSGGNADDAAYCITAQAGFVEVPAPPPFCPVYIYVCMYMYVYMCACVRVCVYTHTYTHTHTHTCMLIYDVCYPCILLMYITHAHVHVHTCERRHVFAREQMIV